MTIRVGTGFYITSALGVGGVDAEGTVLLASDLGQIVNIQTDGSLVPGNAAMNTGDSFIVDTDGDNDFSDEASTTQIDNDRYSSSTITYADGSTSNITLELVSLSDGTQAIVVNDVAAGRINAASDQIQSITLGSFNSRFDNRYNQANFTNNITNTVVCFCEETLIQTPTGEQMVGALAAGDDVVTAQDGIQKIVWIGKHRLSTAQLVASPHLRPVRIKAGALAEGAPHTDLLVSPQHRLLIASKIAERMFGQREVFIPAIKLLQLDKVEQVTSVAPVTYVHILLETHQVIFANGALAESLFTGPQTLQALSDQALREIFELFPELDAGGQLIPLAHPSIEKQSLVNTLLARHHRNRKQLVMLEALDGSEARF